jgi:hypothetical protein
MAVKSGDDPGESREDPEKLAAFVERFIEEHERTFAELA